MMINMQFAFHALLEQCVKFSESVYKTCVYWAGDGGTPKMARVCLRNSIIQQPGSHGKVAEWQNAVCQKKQT